jgi:hypothetical protein
MLFWNREFWKTKNFGNQKRKEINKKKTSRKEVFQGIVEATLNLRSEGIKSYNNWNSKRPEITIKV